MYYEIVWKEQNNNEIKEMIYLINSIDLPFQVRSFTFIHTKNSLKKKLAFLTDENEVIFYFSFIIRIFQDFDHK